MRKKKKVVKLKEEKELDSFTLDIHSFLDEKNYLADFDEKTRLKFLGEASSIFNKSAFIKVINELMNIQASHSILQSSSSPLIMFDRAGINVLKLLKDEFKRLDGMYKDAVKVKEGFDEDEIL